MSILNPTVLVIGAGGSCDFGFPLGIELRNRICALVETADTIRLLVELGHPERQIDSFRNELRYSGFRSIDVFLESNPEFLEIGKQAIAACLLPCETESRLFPPGAPSNHWYERLAGIMGIGLDLWETNRLAIITFNYDRSLEHYFTRVIAQRRRLRPDAAYQVFSSVQLVHVHGSLGSYPPDNDGGVPYGAPITHETVSRAAGRIQVVSEASDTLPTFDAASALLERAEKVYFLGFGFHPANVRRLRRFNMPPDEGRKFEVSGTNHGFSDRDWDFVAAEILNGHWTGGTYRATPDEFLMHRASF